MTFSIGGAHNLTRSQKLADCLFKETLVATADFFLTVKKYEIIIDFNTQTENSRKNNNFSKILGRREIFVR